MKTLLLLSILYFIFLASCLKNNSLLSNNISELKVDGPPITRSEVILIADKYTRVRWTMTETNREGINCGGRFVSDYPAGNRFGMGYKWGGWDTVEDFLEKIEAGFGTGTGGGVTYQEYPFDCVTGISCTGLVSRAWHLNEKYTLNYSNPDIENKFEEITQIIEGVDFINQQTFYLQKGDAFINTNHTILYVYETRDGVPMVMDSRLQGVSFRAGSWSDLYYQGYSPIRYNNIINENNPIGTINNPILINSSSLPYTYDGNTRNVVSMEFDAYSTEPATNEQGPEVIFKLDLPSSSTINIHITDVKNQGIDNNIHILTSLDKNNDNIALNCIAKDDVEINQILDIGAYYIVVDSGQDLPGEYTLTVNSTSQ